eukprot:ANDGO_06738.mRNA.1 Glycogen phosphorylase 1
METPVSLPRQSMSPSGYPEGFVPGLTHKNYHGRTFGPGGHNLLSRHYDKPSEKLLKMFSESIPVDPAAIEEQVAHHLKFTLGRTKFNVDQHSTYLATSYSLHDRLVERWNATQGYMIEKNVRRAYYMSMEFLLGRSLQNTIMNMGLDGAYERALLDLGYKLEDLFENERDAALGNGGLGRLAACFMDSCATLDYPVWGYGLRYQYGMFEQQIRNGFQTEHPDYWLTHGNAWEIQRLDINYPVGFYGSVVDYTDPADGSVRKRWDSGESVFAVAYDIPVPGFGTKTCSNIRLWAARPDREFDLSSFNQGNYFSAIESKQRSENITAVLYPNDSTDAGKELRLRQQFFFSSATLQDILRRFKRTSEPWTTLPDKVVIHLNDTHPTISVVEMMRLLIDEEKLVFETAWDITRRCFAFTNHTVLPEALERWSVDLIGRLLPRHLEIIYDINWRFLQEVDRIWPEDVERRRSMSVIEEGFHRSVRMANLAIVGSFSVNGVAEIHTDILKKSVFRYFYEMWPAKFNCKTNGVTPRRWIAWSNPGIAQIFDSWLPTELRRKWITDVSLLKRLQGEAENPDFQMEWEMVKRHNKVRLATYMKKHFVLDVNPDSLFDMHIKRIHEYKRQLLNILSVIERYDRIKSLKRDRSGSSGSANSSALESSVDALPLGSSGLSLDKIVPRTIFFGGKAAPGYAMAKRIIKLINAVAQVVNDDPDCRGLLQVFFIPNYNVSVAEVMIPAAELSQHISTAGTEASGTSNMKFSMNGSLIIGTLDGANVEIREEIGAENMFVFGAKAHEIQDVRDKMRRNEIPKHPRLQRVLALIDRGVFGPAELFVPVIDSITSPNDFYLVQADFASYLEQQSEVDRVYLDRYEWNRRSILSSVRSGKFSSDRTIHEYAKEVWKINSVHVPAEFGTK